MSDHGGTAITSAPGTSGAAGDGGSPAPMAQALRALAVTADFRASADQVRRARNFVSRLLDGWPVADDAVLCVSELASNSVLHSASGEAGGTFSVQLKTVPGEYVWVEVRDQGGSWVRRDQYDGRPHGLDIVGLLAADFGVDGDAQSGWIVWARLDLPGSRAGRAASSPDRGREQSVTEPGPAVNGRPARPDSAGGPADSSRGGLSWRG